MASSKSSRSSRGLAPATVAVSYVLAQCFPTLALLGPRTIQELRGSLAALTAPLDEADVQFLLGRQPAGCAG